MMADTGRMVFRSEQHNKYIFSQRQPGVVHEFIARSEVAYLASPLHRSYWLWLMRILRRSVFSVRSQSETKWLPRSVVVREIPQTEERRRARTLQGLISVLFFSSPRLAVLLPSHSVSLPHICSFSLPSFQPIIYPRTSFPCFISLCPLSSSPSSPSFKTPLPYAQPQRNNLFLSPSAGVH